MTQSEQKLFRKHSRHLRVPVLADEETAIKALAATSGLSVATYLRQLGLGHQVRSILDHQQVRVLAKINADQGRLGGLLKLWLSQDERLAHFDEQQIKLIIWDLLDQLKTLQKALWDIVQKV